MTTQTTTPVQDILELIDLIEHALAAEIITPVEAAHLQKCARRIKEVFE